jgi:hypothetical protein
MEPFDLANRANAEYIDRVYDKYRKDPARSASSGRRSSPALTPALTRPSTAAEEQATPATRSMAVP